MAGDAIVLDAGAVERLGRAVLTGLGAPAASAELVAEHIVTAHQMGLVSHGVIRFAQYTRDIRNGRIDATVVPRLETESATLAVVDGASGFGQLTAATATEIAIGKAHDVGVAVVTTRRCNHIGRLGAFVEQAARAGVVSIAVTAVPRTGHFVVPWGGRDGRMGTNPFAYAFPTTGDPIVGDFATSVIPEGRIRAARNAGADLPEGAVLDADGQPTRDPAAFYGPPMGSILPFGGIAGHKGYGLALFVELLGASLAAQAPTDDARSINGFTIIAIDAAAFAHPDAVRETATELAAYMQSSRPIAEDHPVLVPGGREFAALRAARELGTITVDAETWRELDAIAQSLDVAVPAVAGAA
jgi:uncharacterized oxidoreductase